jgi:hypothetical protein
LKTLSGPYPIIELDNPDHARQQCSVILKAGQAVELCNVLYLLNELVLKQPDLIPEDKKRIHKELYEKFLSAAVLVEEGALYKQPWET